MARFQRIVPRRRIQDVAQAFLEAREEDSEWCRDVSIPANGASHDEHVAGTKATEPPPRTSADVDTHPCAAVVGKVLKLHTTECDNTMLSAIFRFYTAENESGDGV